MVRLATRNNYAEIGKESCLFSSKWESFRINALTNSLATLELLSARHARNVFKTRPSSASGRTVTPFRATNKAPTFTKNATHTEPHQPAKETPPRGAVKCLILVGCAPRLSARRIIVSYNERMEPPFKQNPTTSPDRFFKVSQSGQGMPICPSPTWLYKKDSRRSLVRGHERGFRRLQWLLRDIETVYHLNTF